MIDVGSEIEDFLCHRERSNPPICGYFERLVDLDLSQLIHFRGLIGGFAAETGFLLWVLFEMVCFHNSISVCNSVDQSGIMATSLNSGDACSKSRQNNHVFRNRKIANSPNSAKTPDCSRSRSAVIDLVMLIAVLGACGFLLFPYVKLIACAFVKLFGAIFYLVKEELARAPMVYGSLGVSILFAAIAVWGILICTSRKCGNPNCRGLRKAAEFDIQLETEDCVKNSSSFVKDGLKKGLFELPRDHHRELEAELKKMAPPNGRAVLVFRARCGCSVGRMEVPGPKKLRKFKKQG